MVPVPLVSVLAHGYPSGRDDKRRDDRRTAQRQRFVPADVLAEANEIADFDTEAFASAVSDVEAYARSNCDEIGS